MDLFWDTHTGQHRPDVSSAADRAPEHRIRDLEARVDRLSMICCAMWTVIQSTADVSDARLADLVQELDLIDGVADGKARVEQVQPCATCNRPLHARHQKCIYCGTPRRADSPFDSVL
ncbi:MAG: hypothetical protein AAF432_15965 [Planctomycetota bacterium]